MIRLPRPVVLACAAILIPSARAQLVANPIWESGNLGTTHSKGIAFDASGNLYVSDGTYPEVRVYKTTGGVLGAQTGSISVTAPRAVAIRPGTADPRVYVVSGTTSATIRVFNPEADPPSVPAIFPACGSPYPTIEQLRFSPDGTTLYVTTSGLQNTNTKLAQSIVRVWKCTAGDTWTDTGLWLAPRGSDLTAADPNPRSNQGQSHGLAVDSNGNVWVASDTDPMMWNGSTDSSTSYRAYYGRYARPMRYYQRVIDGVGQVSFVPAAEIPLDNKIIGIAVNGSGVLFAAESINTATSTILGLPAGIAKSHRIYAYRGTNRVGYIETNAGTGPIEDLQFLDIRPGDTGPTVQGKRGTSVFVQQFSVTGLPTVPARTVQGHVTNARTGETVIGATVRLYNRSVVTDNSGHYTLTVPDSGAASCLNEGAPLPPDPFYILTADATGYLRTLVEKVRVRADMTMDIRLHKDTEGVSASLGALDAQRGLRMTNVADGDTVIVPTNVENTTGRRTMANTQAPIHLTGNTVNDSRFYFDVDDSYDTGSEAGTPMLLSARWYDDGTHPDTKWRILYDAGSTNHLAPSSVVSRSSIPRLRTEALYLPNAVFGNGQASGSDFTIQDQFTWNMEPQLYPVTVLDVGISPWMPQLNWGGTAPEGWAAGVSPPYGRFEGTPTVYDGIAYVGTSYSQIVALDLVSGRPVEGFGPGGFVQLSDKLAGRPVVYIGADNKPHVVVATLNGAIYSLNGKTGAADWSFTEPFFPLGEGTTISAAPCVYMDTSVSPAVPLIWVGINTGGLARLVRLRGDTPQTDKLVLELKDASTNPVSNIACAPAVGANGTRVMAAFDQGGNGHLLMVDNPEVGQSGGTAPTVRTDITIPGESINVPATLTVDGMTLLLGSGNDTTGHVWAVNKDNGQPAWSAAVGPVAAPMWLDYTPPADTLYVMTRDDRLHALDLGHQGQSRGGWPVRPPMGMLGGSLFTIGGNLYAGSNLGLLVTSKSAPGSFTALAPLNPGSQGAAVTVCALDSGASVTAPPQRDKVVATGSDGKLYCFFVQP